MNDQGPQTRALTVFDMLSHEDQLRLILAALVKVDGTIPLPANDHWTLLLRTGMVRLEGDNLTLTRTGEMAVIRITERYLL